MLPLLINLDALTAPLFFTLAVQLMSYTNIPPSPHQPILTLAAISALAFLGISCLALCLSADLLAGIDIYWPLWIMLRATKQLTLCLMPVFALFVYGLIVLYHERIHTISVTRDHIYLSVQAALMCFSIVCLCASLKLFLPTRGLVLNVSSNIALGALCVFLLVGAVHWRFKKQLTKAQTQKNIHLPSLLEADRRKIIIRANAALMVGFMIIPYAFLELSMSLDSVSQISQDGGRFRGLGALIEALIIIGSFTLAGAGMVYFLAVFKKTYPQNQPLEQQLSVLRVFLSHFSIAYLAFIPFYISYFWFMFYFCEYSPYKQFFSLKIVIVLGVLAVLILICLVSIAQHLQKGRWRIITLLICIAPMLLTIGLGDLPYALRGETLEPLFRGTHTFFLIYLCLAVMTACMHRGMRKI